MPNMGQDRLKFLQGGYVTAGAQTGAGAELPGSLILITECNSLGSGVMCSRRPVPHDQPGCRILYWLQSFK